MAKKAETLGIGRIVHYDGETPAHEPALVQRVWSPEHLEAHSLAVHTIDLTAFGDSTNPIHYEAIVPFDPTGELGGSWHWPEMVE